MALFDVVGGLFLWAPFTLVIAGLMGYTVGAICEKKQTIMAYVLAPLTSHPWSLVQIGLATVIVLPVLPKLRKHAAVFSRASK
ncbi:hypothetical protein SATMO3_13210 [Sporomusa aerivorans]